MQIVMDKVNIPTSIIPMIEYPDDFYFVGSRYMKDGLSAIGRSNKYFEGPSDQIYTKESVYLKSLGANYDTETPVTYGCGSTGSVYREENGVMRYETQGKSKTIVNGLSMRDVNTTYQPMEVLYKGSGYDVIKVRGVAANTIHLYVISTVDGTAAALATTAVTYVNYKYMDEDTSYVYFWAFKENGKVNIIKFDKTAKTSTVITTVSSLNMETGPKASFYTKNVLRKIYTENNKQYIPVIYVDASNVVKLRVIVYDKSVASSDITTKVSYADYTLTGTITTPVTNVSGYQYYFQNDGTLVIGHVIWGVGTSMGAASVDMFGLYTLTLDHTAKTATVNSFTQASTLVPVHYIFANDNEVYAVTARSYAKLQYDSTNKKFIKMPDISTSHISFGIDGSGLLYYTYLKGADVVLACITPYMVDAVEVVYATGESQKEITSVTYPFDSNIKVRAKSPSGDLLAKVVTLSIPNGPAVFKANGLKTIEVTTLTTDYVTVPITITGRGDFIFLGKVSGTVS